MGGGKSSCVIDVDRSPTLTCTHYGEPAVAYGIEPGVAARVGGGGRIVEEATPTLRSHMGDNQLAVAYGKGNSIGVDLYNGAITGETAVTILSESNITSTRVGPFILENRNGKED